MQVVIDRALLSNKSVDTDAQVRPLPSVAPSLVRRSLSRYSAG
jgi:hypothetical protein